MWFDWLASEGWIIFNWWLLVTVAGAAVLPLMLRLLGGLPDRGYTLARPAGLLLTAFVFWLLASLGFLNNTQGSIALSWLIVLAISLAVYFRFSAEFDIRAWWQENRTVVIVTEVLFIVLLVGWATFRAYQNNLSATEKPMDLAFMSAIFRSETFPPNDPWLSGYTISYYYFGYVMAAMLSKMSGVWTTIGYNMHIATLFALTGTATFGIIYNMVRSRVFLPKQSTDSDDNQRPTPRSIALGFGMVGMVFMILLGNFQVPLVEYPYNSGLADESYLAFWDTNDRWTPRDEAAVTDDVTRWDFWWWFKGARTISDRNLLDPDVYERSQLHVEAIAEFPQFSFLLADSHPHVMALPYVLLAIGLALNVLLVGYAPDGTRTLFYGVCVGALVFLNTWDAPIYIMVLVGAEVLRRYSQRRRLTTPDWAQITVFGAALLLITIIAYLPFLVGFQSQLGGILPNLIYPTHSPQFFLMFGPFILLLMGFLGVEIWRGKAAKTMNWTLGGQVIAGMFFALVGALVLFTLFGLLNDSVRASALGYIDGNGGLDGILPEVFGRRISSLPMLILLLAGVAIVVARLFPRAESDIPPEPVDPPLSTMPYAPATGFALMLVGVGLMLTLIPEFVYLRDNFGTRMNTVFKFYYQAWVVWSIASAYGLYVVFVNAGEYRISPAFKSAFAVVTAAVFILGMMYPVLGIHNRMFIETGRNRAEAPITPTLDGGPNAVYISPADYDVLMCLHDLVEGDDVVVGEATGGSYDTSGRVGALTGLPSVIGWQPHQGQWRGTAYSETVGSRPEDIPELYEDLRFDVALEIINRYGIDYILYGDVERGRYGSAGEDKFIDNLDVVCQTPLGSSRIYRVDPQLTAMAP